MPNTSKNTLPQRYWQRWQDWLWRAPLQNLPRLSRYGIRFLRYVYVLIRDVLFAGLNLRAMSLVFTTFLGIIPLVALTFFILKMVNAENQLTTILHFLSQPFGNTFSQGITEPTHNIAQQLDPKVLGTVGIGFLLYIALTLIQKIESAFNFIWHIEKSSGLLRRLGDYLVMLIVLGISLSVMLSFLDSAMQYAWLRQILDIKEISDSLAWLNRIMPFLVMWGCISLAYWFVPNTRVHFSSAMYGALFSAILLNIIGWIFGAFIATSSNYQAVYSGFAITVLMLVAIHLMWFAVLLGARLSYYCNDPRHLAREDNITKYHGRMRERLALTIMGLVGQRFNQPEQAAWTTIDLLDHLQAPDNAVLEVLDSLVAHGLLDYREGSSITLYPAYALEKMPISEVIVAVRSGCEAQGHTQYHEDSYPEVETIMSQLDTTITGAFALMTVHDMVAAKNS